MLVKENLEKSDVDEINDLHNKLQAHEINSDDTGQASSLVKLQSDRYSDTWTQAQINDRKVLAIVHRHA